jgi:hypothetical protein
MIRSTDETWIVGIDSDPGSSIEFATEGQAVDYARERASDGQACAVMHRRDALTSGAEVLTMVAYFEPASASAGTARTR